MNAIELNQVSFGYGRATLFKSLTQTIEPGEFLGITGPNGAGKTTLLRLMAGILCPRSGHVSVLGRDLRVTPRIEIARSVAVVPQEADFPFNYSVSEVVMMGRHPWLGRFARPNELDRRLVTEALDFCNISHLAASGVNEISSGEKQRVLLARALAQQAKILLLDEATSHLDIAHQHLVGQMLAELNRQGRTIVLISHDLNLAALLCHRIVVLERGVVMACGTPENVITRDMIRRAYGLEPIVVAHPVAGRPQLLLPTIDDVDQRTNPASAELRPATQGGGPFSAPHTQ